VNIVLVEEGMDVSMAMGLSDDLEVFTAECYGAKVVKESRNILLFDKVNMFLL
jgi:hypothetical protein